jgi:hypothetical protein
MGLGLLGALKGHSESPVPSLELGSGLAVTRMLRMPPLLSLLPLAAAGGSADLGFSRSRLDRL